MDSKGTSAGDGSRGSVRASSPDSVSANSRSTVEAGPAETVLGGGAGRLMAVVRGAAGTKRLWKRRPWAGSACSALSPPSSVHSLRLRGLAR